MVIIDTTQTKIEQQISEIRQSVWFSPICTPRWDKGSYYRASVANRRGTQSTGSCYGGLEYVQPVTKELIEQGFSRRGRTMTEEDKQFLWELMPNWIKKPEVGLCPTMYGTGSFKSDWAVHERVVKLLNMPKIYPTIYVDINDDLAVESMPY